MCVPQPSVGLLLVLDVVEALGGGQVLLVVLDGLLVVSQGVVAVGQVPVGPAPVQQALGAAQLLQHGQLLLEVADGLLEHAHVQLGDAHVPVDLSLQAGVPEALRQAELGLVTLEGGGEVPQGHVHGCQVAQGATLPLLVARVLPQSQLLAVEGQGRVELAEEPAEGKRKGGWGEEEEEEEAATCEPIPEPSRRPLPSSDR